VALHLDHVDDPDLLHAADAGFSSVMFDGGARPHAENDGGIAAAVAAGIRKVNIGTALNVALTGAVRSTLRADAALTDPRRYLGAGRDAMAEAVRRAALVVSDRPPVGSSLPGPV